MQARDEVTWTPEQVSRFWDYQSHRPSALRNYFSIGRGEQVAKRTLRHISPHQSARILDLGCGTGHFLEQLARIGPGTLLHGIDFSTESIQVAKKTCRSIVPTPDLEAIESYPTHLPADSFDAAYSIEVVEHLSDNMLDSMIIEARRVLKKGGYLVITTPNNEDLERSHTCCPNCSSTFHIWQHVRAWSTRSLSQFMSGHGFTEVFAKETFLEPLHLRICIWIARKLGVVKRQPPHIIAIYRK